MVYECDSLRLLSFQQQPGTAQQQQQQAEELETIKKDVADRNLDIKICCLDVHGA